MGEGTFHRPGRAGHGTSGTGRTARRGNWGMNSALFHLGVMDAGHSQAVRPPPRAEHAQGAQCRRRARRRGPGAAYALGGKALEAYGEGAPPISPKGEMDLPKPCTPFPQTVKCIKGTVTYQLNTPYGPPRGTPPTEKNVQERRPGVRQAQAGGRAHRRRGPGPQAAGGEQRPGGKTAQTACSGCAYRSCLSDRSSRFAGFQFFNGPLRRLSHALAVKCQHLFQRGNVRGVV